MDLNHIKLPVTVIKELYGSVLVEPVEKPVITQNSKKAEASEKTNPGKAPEWKFLGTNNKKILIVVNNPDAVFMSDNDLNFLTGVLGACQLTLADVAIVNRHPYPDAGFKELSVFFKSRIVLLFGTEPAAFGLPINFPPYQLQAFADNTFLFAPSLEEIEKDRLEKSKLWVSLKRLFNV